MNDPCAYPDEGGPCRGPVKCRDHYAGSIFGPPGYLCDAHVEALSKRVYTAADGIETPLPEDE